ncbi:response regulator transcription factor [Chitinophaga arvensicola]|uniref:DNA-binding response regulator, OmpR family, contains REC and winged-helix (WHTH) domain n=1 Tax=Chitinophaga arvensicola TaxID=29529 RepID=A0A1I0S7K5_9BACT|nr:response regulator transcription factor [Chitinophaga arvensicola]SEW51758.1 DNA-binding response regulator, OmpR family, contains REC and winged-helix (wHTH) domain [Chitinophaga arvensicola]
MSIRILYVEDELSLGKIVKESLQRRGYEVILESDGAHVISLFKQTNPAVCILDIMLPNKDGFELAAEIRALDQEVPILFLTAKTQTNDLVKGFTLGGNDYIRKPFSMEELIVRIENVLRKSDPTPATAANHIKIGKFRFYSHRQVLANDVEEKKLSYKESELLKLLYENRHDIIDRKNILDLLWGHDSFFNSRNLDVYITRLRVHLKEDDNLQILTIKGVGYRFVLG